VLPHSMGLRMLLIFLFVVGIAGIFLFFLAGEKIPLTVTRILYMFSTSWLIAFIYLFISVILIDVFRLLNAAFHFIDKETIQLVFKNNPLTLVIVFGFVAMLLLYGNICYHNKKRITLEITTDKIEKPIRIVGISDLHIGYTISAKEVAKWVARINSEKPDMVIIGGDIIDNHLRAEMKKSAELVLKQIDAPLGVYSCTGNHDLMFAVREDIGFYKRSGITLLRDSTISLDEFVLIGRDDYTNKHRKTLQDIMKQSKPVGFTILLDHQPQYLDEAVNNEIDFQFSGHTHYGQIFPASLITNGIFELSHGYKQKGNTHFYVSSGIGIWGGKFRIGTRSEYLVLDLKPSK
jgi:predicted MPP superfamily phosphohydrolase